MYLVPLQTCAYSCVPILCYPVSLIPVYIALLCFHSSLPISPTLAMSLDFVYKTLIHVCIRHVQILTLTIVLIVYSTLVTQNITPSIPHSDSAHQNYSIFNLTSMLKYY